MTTSAATRSAPRKRRIRTGTLVGIVVGVAVLVGMVLDTTIVSDEDDAAANVAFSAVDWAEVHYGDTIEPWIVENAVDAVELQEAIAADVDAAGEEYGGRAGANSAWAFPVEFSGVAGKVDAIFGRMPVTVEGMPDDMEVFVQMGPAISGQALRDVTGEVRFGMFTNQTEYQTVALELNNKVTTLVLADFDAAELEGETVDVVGVFSYSSASPNEWLVVPVRFEVAS